MEISVTATQFDALLRAGLLRPLGINTCGDTSWEFFGRTNDDDTVSCELKTDEELNN